MQVKEKAIVSHSSEMQQRLKQAISSLTSQTNPNIGNYIPAIPYSQWCQPPMTASGCWTLIFSKAAHQFTRIKWGVLLSATGSSLFASQISQQRNHKTGFTCMLHVFHLERASSLFPALRYRAAQLLNGFCVSPRAGCTSAANQWLLCMC